MIVPTRLAKAGCSSEMRRDSRDADSDDFVKMRTVLREGVEMRSMASDSESDESDESEESEESESESESESVSERAVDGAALLAEMVCTEESRTCRELTARRAEQDESATKEGATDKMV